jgi:hypothetical protein
MSQTFSSNILRVTTRFACRIKYSSKRYSCGSRSIGRSRPHDRALQPVHLQVAHAQQGFPAEIGGRRASAFTRASSSARERLHEDRRAGLQPFDAVAHPLNVVSMSTGLAPAARTVLTIASRRRGSMRSMTMTS